MDDFFPIGHFIFAKSTMQCNEMLTIMCNVHLQISAYLKGTTPLGARIKGRTRDTWLLIGAVIAAVSLLIILAIVFTFGLSNKRGNQNARNENNKKHVFEAEEGNSNLAFLEDSELKVRTDYLRLTVLGRLAAHSLPRPF